KTASEKKDGWLSLQLLEEAAQIHLSVIFHEQGFIFMLELTCNLLQEQKENDHFLSGLVIFVNTLTLVKGAQIMQMEDKNFFESLLSSMKWASAEVAKKGTWGINEFHLIS
ncbi:hypothetical protein ACJX0J_024483, partial [Zea mays]